MTEKNLNITLSEPRKLCIIPARIGSKGVPEKNSRILGGKPLVAWTIEAAINSGAFDQIIVSSDCANIREITESLGAEFKWRPASLAQDQIHASRVVLDILDQIQMKSETPPESVAMLLPTSPFRTPNHIKEAANIIDTTDCSSVIGVVRTGKYLNNIRFIQSNTLIPIVEKSDLNHQRQGQEELLFVNGAIFFARAKLFQQEKLHNASAPEMNYVSSIDINEQDFGSKKLWIYIRDENSTLEYMIIKIEFRRYCFS